jgi:hypothetical protein
MPRPINEKCRRCAKLTDEQAKHQHGAEGDGCWVGQPCHDRRSYYRHRDIKNLRRKQKRHHSSEVQPLTSQPPTININLPSPATPAAVAQFYRETKNSPLHAIGAELWLGNHRALRIEPIHCLGMTESQIEQFLKVALTSFSEHLDRKIDRFRSAVELHPENCLLTPCPLHPER